MKRYFFLLMGCALLVSGFTSCEFRGRNDYTPSLYTSCFFIHYPDSTAGDTLGVHYMGESGTWQADTIAQGDTVRFVVGVNSYANNLVSFGMTWDTAAMCVELYAIDSIRPGLNMDSTNAGAGLLVFKPGYNYASFPVRYTPRKAGVHKVTMTVTSDSNFPTSSLSFTQPVR